MRSRTWLAAALATAAIAQAAAQAPASSSTDPSMTRDLLLEQRRANLPATQPWPIDFFQPQAVVKGASRDVLHRTPAPQHMIAPEALEAALAYAKSAGSTAFLVYHDGALVQEWYAQGSGPATLTHSYTMHWVPVALLVGIAIGEGKIGSVDDPVAKYLPEWRGTPKESITLRNLLQQNAGLDLRFDASKSSGLYSRDARAYWGSNSLDVVLREYQPVHTPGTVFDYNYISPVILGVVLERATGQSYVEYLSAKLWKPLANFDARVWLNRRGGEAHLDAGLFAGPRDWLHLGVMMLDEGRFAGRQVVPAAWIDLMREPSKTNANWGFTYLGSPFQAVRRMATDPRVTYVVKSSEPFAASDVFYVDGYGGQRVFVVPSRRLVVVRLGEVAREGWDNSRAVNLLVHGIDKTGGK